MKHDLTHILLHLIWFHDIRIKYVKMKPPRTIIRKNAISRCLHVFMLWTLVDLFLMKRLFSQETVIILPEIKTGSFTIEFRWSWSLNKLRTGTLCRIFKYSTEYLKVANSLDSYLLTIKKKRVVFSGASRCHKGIPYYSKKICKYLKEYLILPECFEFVLQIIIQNTSTSRAKRQNFNRAPNFASVPWLCTVQNTSFSQAKTHLRTLFSNTSYFFRKGKAEKLFHTSRSSRPEVFCK